MSHGIIAPIDNIISTLGAEWHGLAIVKPVIDDAVASPFLFDIFEAPIVANVTGSTAPVSMSAHKALIANLGAVRPDLNGQPQHYVPLHIPKKSYQQISNREVWTVMSEAIRGVSATVTCIGTLEGAKKFFISVKLAEDDGKFTVNGDEYRANLNFVTSHDGTLGMCAYDSFVRIVCMNTLRASLTEDAKGNLEFKVYHSKGAQSAMKNLGGLINQVLTGRARFRSNMEYLAGVPCTTDDARLIAFGYFAQESDKPLISKRAENSANEIARLFLRGKGNNGRSLYDMLNGATEFWTSGDGTGKKADAGTKAYKAEFGDASEHKQAFANLLLSPEKVNELKEAGRLALVEIARSDRSESAEV